MISTFGDSIMRGVMSDTKKENGRPKYKISEQGFVSRCERRLGVKILNFSCFGSTTTQGMKYMERYGSEVKASNVAVFEYGGNDCDFDWAAVAAEPHRQHQPKVMLKRFVQQYNALIDSVKKMNIRPVILSMPVIDPDRFFETVSFGLNRDNTCNGWAAGQSASHIGTRCTIWSFSNWPGKGMSPLWTSPRPFWSRRTTTITFVPTASIPTSAATPSLPRC